TTFLPSTIMAVSVAGDIALLRAGPWYTRSTAVTALARGNSRRVVGITGSGSVMRSGITVTVPGAAAMTMLESENGSDANGGIVTFVNTLDGLTAAFAVTAARSSKSPGGNG